MLYITLGSVEGAVIFLKSISVEPCVSATIQYTLTNNDGSIKELTHIVEGEQYKKWGTDDTLIYHLLCAKHKLHYKPYVEPEFFEEIIVSADQETSEMKYETIRYPNPKYNPNPAEYKPIELPTSSIVYETDNRSVHNDKDLETINNLQSELDAQKAKIDQINKLLIARGIL
jgi:hypothetical protein